MDFIDYREKLGIGFSDDEKFASLKSRVFNDITPPRSGNFGMSVADYYDFFNYIGLEVNHNLTESQRDDTERYADCVHVIREHTYLAKDFLSYYIALANCMPNDNKTPCNREYMKAVIERALVYSHIQFQTIKEDDQFFIFPKGAKELDDALITEPLEWLKDYPQSRKTFCIALRQYSDGIYIRDVADNLRKALEEFLQEFLGNTKNLENNKIEICKFLKSQNVNPDFCGLFQPLLNTYKGINDKYAKHNDLIDGKMLEFLIYQTGIFIRMIIISQNNP